jgi:hypothetical protein
VVVKVFEALAVIIIGIGLHVLWKYYTSGSKEAFKESIGTLKGKKLILYCIALALWLLFVSLLFYFLNGICVCLYNDFFVNQPLTITYTRRSYLKGKFCPSKTICQIFATLPESTNTSVFINIHTGLDI